MSKAFVKESDVGEEEELHFDEPLESGFRNYMSPQCWARLHEELRVLRHVDRPDVVRTVEWAAGNGDRSENGDYIYGKKRLREIDRKIRSIERKLDQAEVVDASQQPKDRISFGARIQLQCTDLETGQEQLRTVHIVGIDETDPPRGLISWKSPIATALLGAKPGDSVVARLPKGELELEVLSFDYPHILLETR